MRFRDDVRDFVRFVRRPVLGPRRACGLGLPVNASIADWLRLPRLRRMLAWAASLWLLSLLVFAPLIVNVTQSGGATHRIVLHQWLWLQAIVWAPIAEELVFRYWLRRPVLGLALLPPMVVALVNGPKVWTGLLLAAVLVVLWWPAGRRRMSRRAFRLLAWYRRLFPLVFHLSAVAFAIMHLVNFNLGQVAWWLFPVLVLPQWLAGLVLGWARVRAGIGAAIVLHGIYNAGPIIVITLLSRFLPTAL